MFQVILVVFCAGIARYEMLARREIQFPCCVYNAVGFELAVTEHRRRKTRAVPLTLTIYKHRLKGIVWGF